MLKWSFHRDLKSRRRRRQSRSAEQLETRALLSTFYVNGDTGQTGNTGAADSPFATIDDGIRAAMASPGDDEVVIEPTDQPYTENIVLTLDGGEGWGYPEMNGDLIIRGSTGNSQDVVLSSTYGINILSEAAIDVTIADLTIRDSGNHGIEQRGTGVFTVDGVHVDSAGKGSTYYSGIAHLNGSLVVRNSTLSNNYQGIWSVNYLQNVAPASLTVENTITRSNLNHGIYSSGVTGEVSVTNLQSTGHRYTGTYVANAGAVTISGGAFTGNTGNGITLNQIQGDINLLDVSASQNGSSGIAIAKSQAVNIVGGTLAGNTRQGVHASDVASISIDGTSLTGNGADGVVAIRVAGAVQINDITATDNTLSGAAAIFSGPVTVTNSVLNSNGGRGLYVNEAETASITTSEFADNLIQGALLRETPNIQISDSSFTGNTLNGLILPLANGAMLDNLVVENNGTVTGTAQVGGAGININPVTSAPITISNSSIRNNLTRWYGAGLEVWMNATATPVLANVSVSNTAIDGNTIGEGATKAGAGVSVRG